jgi:hypothetical protein
VCERGREKECECVREIERERVCVCVCVSSVISSCVMLNCSDGQRTSHEYGQSPGVKTKLPLHVVHTVHLQMSRPATKVTLRHYCVCVCVCVYVCV